MRVIRDRHGVSNIIVFVLGLVIVSTIVVNVFLWNYEMNQLDWERMREEVEVVDVSQSHPSREGTCFTFKNKGPLTTHLVSLWIINPTIHRRYDMDLIINSGETSSYVRSDIHLPKGQYVVKVVTERGNIAIYSKD